MTVKYSKESMRTARKIIKAIHPGYYIKVLGDEVLKVAAILDEEKNDD